MIILQTYGIIKMPSLIIPVRSYWSSFKVQITSVYFSIQCIIEKSQNAQVYEQVWSSILSCSPIIFDQKTLKHMVRWQIRSSKPHPIPFLPSTAKYVRHPYTYASWTHFIMVFFVFYWIYISRRVQLFYVHFSMICICNCLLNTLSLDGLQKWITVEKYD